MCESLYQTATAMTTSIEIAEKVAEEVNEEIEGLDALSAYIEKVLSRVKIRVLICTTYIQVEVHMFKFSLFIVKHGNISECNPMIKN